MILTVALSLSLAVLAPQDLEKYIYQFSERKPSPPVVIDVREFPEGKAWATVAKALVENWYPTAISLLSTQDFKPPAEIKLIVKKDLSVPAYASGGSITISGKWITEHPEDFGMVIHELTHVLQRYPGNKSDTGWLVEGIADYVRWWRYEPESQRPNITTQSKMTDGYRVTAYFLAWASKKYDMRLVPMLDLSLRKAEDPIPIFAKVTGKSAEDLWNDFVAATSKRSG